MDLFFEYKYIAKIITRARIGAFELAKITPIKANNIESLSNIEILLVGPSNLKNDNKINRALKWPNCIGENFILLILNVVSSEIMAYIYCSIPKNKLIIKQINTIYFEAFNMTFKSLLFKLSVLKTNSPKILEKKWT